MQKKEKKKIKLFQELKSIRLPCTEEKRECDKYSSVSDFKRNLKCQILKGPFWSCFWPASRLNNGQNDHADVLEKRGSQISREADGSAHRFAPQEKRAHSVEEIVEPGEKGVSVCQTRSCGEKREVSVSR